MEKSSRPVRNRKQSRRIWPPGDIHHRPVKRLFTPDIKKMLKDWLIRRRENPYPSRDEKKTLAYETGLTYTQICNWFANWRRKLKNSGKEPVRKSWGNLIKNYNTSAKGNVEQFSISSSDSIWGEQELQNYENSSYSSDSFDENNYRKNNDVNSYDINNNYLEQYDREPYYPPGYYFMNPNYQYCKNSKQNFEKDSVKVENDSQYFQENSPTLEEYNQDVNFSCNDNQDYIKSEQLENQQQSFSTNTKYKQQIMEKYLKDTNTKIQSSSSSNISSSPELSKWLESAAKFTPNKNNYIEWNSQRTKDKKIQKSECNENITNAVYNTIHQKEELEAAEALANLACNYRQKLMNSTNQISTL